ncbi:MAG: 50S ribosomal protein L13 [Nitrososphaeria archaeon]
MSEKKLIIVDGTNHLLGRLASYVSKLLLQGNKVIIVNAEKILVSGDRRRSLQEYLERQKLKSRVNPIYGPYHAKRPENIVSKTVRGMLPMRKSKGVIAYDRLRVYVGVPKEFEGTEKTSFPSAMARKPTSFYIDVGEISRTLGREVAG